MHPTKELKMEFLIILLVLAFFALMFIISKKRFVQKNDPKDSSADNLRKYFGDDVSKITGSSTSAPIASPFRSNRTIYNMITPENTTDRPVQPSNNVLYGNNPINAVINKKMAGADFLGITINVEREAEMPRNPDEQLCSLVSLMLAKGMGAAAKGAVKIINFSAVSENGNVVISCSYPEKAIPETDVKIRQLAEEMGGSLSSETADGITTDTAVIPEKSN